MARTPETLAWLRRFVERERVSLTPPAFSPLGATPEQVAIAAAAWPLKQAEEARSATVFLELEGLARQLELPTELVGALRRATEDEHFHAALCGQLATMRGLTAAQAHESQPSRTATLAPHRALLTLLTVEVAMGETVSSHLFRAGVHVTREPQARAVLAAIHRDEVRHARLGWEGLRLALTSTAPNDRVWLVEEIRVWLGRLEQLLAVPSLKRLEAAETFDAGLLSLGILSPELRVDAFYGAMERRVLPTLESLGIAAATCWQERYRSRDS